MSKILLFNPKSSINKYRIPNSILNIAASVDGKYDWVIVDGNCEADPIKKIESYLSTGEFKYLGFTVMPGPATKAGHIGRKSDKAKVFLYYHDLGWVFSIQST